MGILNVTPDSFSDGGRYLDAGAAVARGVLMAEEGADLIDVGGESTRPGAEDVPPGVERDRVVPVIRSLSSSVDVPVSIDTRKPEVAEAAVDAGATVVNDVTGAREPRMFDVVRDSGAGLVLMHMRGDPATMRELTDYEDVVADVKAHLAGRLRAAEAAGIAAESLCVDPGLGFAKTAEQSLRLMREIDAFLDLGRPVLAGPSRKSFIGQVLDAGVDERLEGTAAAVAWLAARGAHIVRVHDVAEMARVVRVIDAVRDAGSPVAGRTVAT
jgi:dihydropteroate synthase